MRHIISILTLLALTLGASPRLWAQSTSDPGQKVPGPAAAAPREKVDLSAFFTHGSYSTGGGSDSTALYGLYKFDAVNSIWIGHNHVKYSQTGAFLNGYWQDINNVGGYLALGKNDGLQLDYFPIHDSLGAHDDIYGGEYFHTFTPQVTVGIGYTGSHYAAYSVHQITPRLTWWPTPQVSLNSKLYVTDASPGKSRVAFQEKVTWYVTPQWSLRAGGIAGTANSLVDNDSSTVYTQPQAINGALFAGVDFSPNKNLKLTVHYEHVGFQGYKVDYFLGGLHLKL